VAVGDAYVKLRQHLESEGEPVVIRASPRDLGLDGDAKLDG
jgi:hypothetical protein